jgi:predicted outer membrane repeat protein
VSVCILTFQLSLVSLLLLLPQQCDFIQNRAGAFGGALFTNDNSTLIVDDCTFEGNDAANAACIASAGAVVRVSNSVMRSNTAGGFGAIMLLRDTKQSLPSSITNTTFTGNVGANAGAIYSETDGDGLFITQVSSSSDSSSTSTLNFGWCTSDSDMSLACIVQQLPCLPHTRSVYDSTICSTTVSSV